PRTAARGCGQTPRLLLPTPSLLQASSHHRSHALRPRRSKCAGLLPRSPVLHSRSSLLRSAATDEAAHGPVRPVAPPPVSSGDPPSPEQLQAAACPGGAS